MTTLVLAGWMCAALGMLGFWAWHRRLANAGIVDVGWTVGVVGLAAFYAIFGNGWPVRRLVIAAVVTVWGARLSAYLLRDRIIGRPEDGRYVELRRAWGERSDVRFFWFFQAQALAAVFFSLPAAIASANGIPRWQPIEVAALCLWAVGFAGETAADRQLERFKSDPAHRGRTCRIGLWRYSRHPNYFFEWLVWVAYAAFALGSPWGFVAAACPLAMLYLLFRVTGIPATEAQALRSRGDEYRRYQGTTSAFVPWFPK